jgi:hypothetical protein
VVSAGCLAKNAKKVEHLYREAAFSYYFGTPRPLREYAVRISKERYKLREEIQKIGFRKCL